MRFAPISAFCLIIASTGTAPAAESKGWTPAPLPPVTTKQSALIDKSKVCDNFGAGFAPVPGTETCIKIGGYIRAGGAAGR